MFAFDQMTASWPNTSATFVHVEARARNHAQRDPRPAVQPVHGVGCCSFATEAPAHVHQLQTGDRRPRQMNLGAVVARVLLFACATSTAATVSSTAKHFM